MIEQLFRPGDAVDVLWLLDMRPVSHPNQFGKVRRGRFKRYGMDPLSDETTCIIEYPGDQFERSHLPQHVSPVTILDQLAEIECSKPETESASIDDSSAFGG